MSKLEQIEQYLSAISHPKDSDVQVDRRKIINEINRQNNHPTSLGIKILSIIGGIFATASLLSFLGLAGLFDSKIAVILFGAICVSASVIILKIYNHLLLDTVGLCFYLVGLLLMVFGLDMLKVDENIIAILIILICIITIIINQGYILAFIATMGISTSIIALSFINESVLLPHIIVAIFSAGLTYWILSESKIITGSKKIALLYEPIRVGLIFSLVLSLTLFVFDFDNSGPIIAWPTSIILSILVLFTVYQLLSRFANNTPNIRIAILVISAIILGLTFPAPGISGSLLIILLTFWVNHRTGLAIGTIALLYFTGQYYYDLSYTLLTKSILMCVSGLFFIALYFISSKTMSLDEKI